MAADRPVVSGARTDDVGSAVSRRILSGPLARAVPLLRPYRWTVAALIGLAPFGAVLQVIPDFFAGYVIDAISTRAPGSRVAGLAALATLPVLLSAAVGLAVARRSARIGEGVVYDLRQAMVASLHRQSTLFFKYASTGAVVTRLSGDATGTQRVFGPSLATVVAAGTQLTVAASATFALSWQVGRWYWRRSHCSWARYGGSADAWPRFSDGGSKPGWSMSTPLWNAIRPRAPHCRDPSAVSSRMAPISGSGPTFSGPPESRTPCWHSGSAPPCPWCRRPRPSRSTEWVVGWRQAARSNRARSSRSLCSSPACSDRSRL